MGSHEHTPHAVTPGSHSGGHADAWHHHGAEEGRPQAEHGAIANPGVLVRWFVLIVVTLVAVVLASKERLEGFSRALSQAELSAVLTLAVLAAVVLPVLPDVELGPWGVWNPRKLWLVVVLVCGLSFGAFIAMRVWGERRGLYVSGLLGGLVSSTAATVSFAARSREEPAAGKALAVGAGVASLVMVLRVAVLVAILLHAAIVFTRTLRAAHRLSAADPPPIARRRGAAWYRDEAIRLARMGLYPEAMQHDFLGLVLELDEQQLARAAGAGSGGYVPIPTINSSNVS